MPTINTTEILNWTISGLIGLFFGIISTWVTHRFQLKREKIAWEREKEKLNEEFEQEKSLLKLQFNQKLLELEHQFSQQRSHLIRAEILKGVEDAEESIRRIARYKKLLNEHPIKFGLISNIMVPMFDNKTVARELFQKNSDAWFNELLASKPDITVDEIRILFSDKEFVDKFINILNVAGNPEQELMIDWREFWKNELNRKSKTG